MKKETDITKLIENSVLASPPDLLFKIINSLDSELSSKQIGEIIGHDQSISAQVLKLSNSSFFGFKGNIKTLDRAINVLGTKTVRNIAVTTLLFAHTNRIRLYNLDIMNFWLYTFLVADITREISQKAGLDGDESYIAGLLHAIGKLVLYTQKQDKTDIFVKEHTKNDILQYEKECWGIDYIDLGKMLLEKWNIPEDTVKGVAEHRTSRGENLLSKIIFLSTEFANIVTDPYYTSSVTYPIFNKLLKEMKLSEEDFNKLSVEIPGIVERGKMIMKVMAKNQHQGFVRRRLITRATLVSSHEFSLSKCLLELIGFKVNMIHPDEIKRYQEYIREEEEKHRKELEELAQMDDAEETIEEEDADLPNKTGFFSRLFHKSKARPSSPVMKKEEEDEEDIVKPVEWEPLVLFEDTDPVAIKRLSVTVYNVFKDPAKMKENPIPFFFSSIHIKVK